MQNLSICIGGPEPNIGSIIDAWRAQKFVTYPDLPNWEGLQWSFTLIQGWQQYINKPLAEIAAYQWASVNEIIMRDLVEISSSNYFVIDYQELLNEPHQSIKELCQFCDLPFGPKMKSYSLQGFPASKYTLTQPAADKWRRHQQDINLSKEIYGYAEERLESFVK